MKKTITHKQLIVLYSAIGVYTNDNKGTQLAEVLTRELKKQISPLIEEYNEKITDLALDHAATDEKNKVVLKNEKGGYQFTKEGQRLYNQAAKKLLTETVEIHQREVMGFNDMVGDEELREILSDLIINITPPAQN